MMDFILGGLCAYLACGTFVVCKIAESTWLKYGWRDGRAMFAMGAIMAVFLWPRLISEEVL